MTLSNVGQKSINIMGTCKIENEKTNYEGSLRVRFTHLESIYILHTHWGVRDLRDFCVHTFQSSIVFP